MDATIPQIIIQKIKRKVNNMKNKLEVQDIINYIDNDKYVHIEGVQEWDVHKVGENAYEIEVLFDDYSHLEITLYKDEYFESKLERFTQLVNEFCNKREVM